MVLCLFLGVPSPPPPRLGLAEALSRADQGGAVLVARAQAEAQKTQVETARAPASPVLSVGTTRYSARESVALSEEIRWAGERRYSVRAAEDLAGAASATAEKVLREARRLVRQAWFT